LVEVGFSVGISVGKNVGKSVGIFDGNSVGSYVGRFVGTSVGNAEEPTPKTAFAGLLSCQLLLIRLLPKLDLLSKCMLFFFAS